MSPGRFYFDDADEEQDFHNPHEADGDKEDTGADDNPHGDDADENLDDDSDSEL